MPEVLIEQSITYEKDKETSPIKNTSRTIVGNLYQYYWTIIKIE